MIHLRDLLDKFVTRTMFFMKENINEISLMKTRVARDLKAHDRYIEQK
jgi:hypothetical protein